MNSTQQFNGLMQSEIENLVKCLTPFISFYYLSPQQLVGAACIIQALLKLPEITRGVDGDLWIGTLLGEKGLMKPGDLYESSCNCQFEYCALHISDTSFSLRSGTIFNIQKKKIPEKFYLLRNLTGDEFGAGKNIEKWLRLLEKLTSFAAHLEVFCRIKMNEIVWTNDHAKRRVFLFDANTTLIAT